MISLAPEGGSRSVRRPLEKKPGVPQCYEVILVGGPGDGQKSICSHDTVYFNRELYRRGAGDLYYWVQQAPPAEEVN